MSRATTSGCTVPKVPMVTAAGWTYSNSTDR